MSKKTLHPSELPTPDNGVTESSLVSDEVIGELLEPQSQSGVIKRARGFAFLTLLSLFSASGSVEAKPPTDIFVDPAGPRPQRGPVVQPAATATEQPASKEVWCAKLGKKIPRAQYTNKKCKKPSSDGDGGGTGEISAEDFAALAKTVKELEKKLKKKEAEAPENITSENLMSQYQMILLLLLALGGAGGAGYSIGNSKNNRLAIAGLNKKLQDALRNARGGGGQ